MSIHCVFWGEAGQGLADLLFVVLLVAPDHSEGLMSRELSNGFRVYSPIVQLCNGRPSKVVNLSARDARLLCGCSPFPIENMEIGRNNGLTVQAKDVLAAGRTARFLLFNNPL